MCHDTCTVFSTTELEIYYYKSPKLCKKRYILDCDIFKHMIYKIIEKMRKQNVMAKEMIKYTKANNEILNEICKTQETKKEAKLKPTVTSSPSCFTLDC